MWRIRLLPAGLMAAMVVFLSVAPASAAPNVAVFNFQMKSDTPDWKWLEKGLADRIATDFVQERTLHRLCLKQFPKRRSRPRPGPAAPRTMPPTSSTDPVPSGSSAVPLLVLPRGQPRKEDNSTLRKPDIITLRRHTCAER